MSIVPADGPDQRLADEARHRVLDMISSGALRPGDKLGTERALAAELSVSRSTLRQVLAVLAQAGVVRRVPGRSGGTFVAHSKVDRDLSVIVGLPEYLRRQGFVAGTQVLSATMTGADESAAAHLDVPAGSLVVDIARIRLADGSPDEAALLGIADRAPLLAITRTSRNADGVPFEFSNDLFRADRTCVTFRTKAERAEIVGRGDRERLAD